MVKLKEKFTKNHFSHKRNHTISLFTIKFMLITIISLSCGWCLIPRLIHWQIGKKILIWPEQSPEFYSMWTQPPVPVYFKVYIFNVSNPGEIEDGMSPSFQEVGPYIFQEIRNKTNITLDESSDTATYKEHITYKFQDDLSGNLSLEDVVTMVNVPFAAAVIKIQRDVPWPLSHFAHMILLNYKEPLFVQRTVNEALFKGWSVPFLEKIEEDIGLTFLKNNTFGFFADLNNSMQGPYTVMRGLHGDKRLLGSVIKYRDEPQLPFWGDRNSTCNRLRGTDGFIFPPFATKDTTLTVFNSDLCGSINLYYHSDVLVEGVAGYKFTVPQSELLGPREKPENRCFCKTIDNEPEKCLGSGAVDLGPCRDGAPIALSLPHFLDGDPIDLARVADGLKPERGKHETYIEIEPLTGILIQARKRIQLNLIMRQVPSIPVMRKVKEMLFPCVWAEQGGRIDNTNAERLITPLIFISLAENSAKYCSIFIIIVVAVLFLKKLFIDVEVEGGDIYMYAGLKGRDDIANEMHTISDEQKLAEKTV